MCWPQIFLMLIIKHGIGKCLDAHAQASHYWSGCRRSFTGLLAAD